MSRNEPPAYEPNPDDISRWRRRNTRLVHLMRGLAVGLIAVAVLWFVYRLLR